MREQIAKILGEGYFTDRDWEDYSQGAKELFYKEADAILSLMREEIKKELLTSEELKICLQAMVKIAPQDVKRDQAKLWALALRVIAQAQLQKILKKMEEPVQVIK